MSGQYKSNPDPENAHPPHGHPDNTGSSAQPVDKPSTASNPHPWAADPTIQGDNNAGSRGQNIKASASSNAASPDKQIANLSTQLKGALRQFPDFPEKGILFEDILPIFADAELHGKLIDALELHITSTFSESQKPDIIIGLEARGFLFGPSLALRLGCGFVPLRKKGKLPGPTETAGFKKEYGEDFFQIQKDVIKQGMRVVVVDDIIATGGSAAAAGELVRREGGTLLEYVFLMELTFLNGRKNLDAPVYTLLSGQEEKLGEK
jgi:adenine phosphoribosyltransferase